MAAMGVCATYSCNLPGPLGPLVTKESSPELGDGDTWRGSEVCRPEFLRLHFPVRNGNASLAVNTLHRL